MISTHGYWVIFVGTALEGETVLVLGGLAAHEGYLQLWLVILAAFTGSLLGDQTFYWIGRRHGRPFLARRPHWQDRADQANRLLASYGTVFTIGFRFLYGLRTVTPFAIGAAGMSPARFTPLNVIGAALWAVSVGSLGYAFGHVAERMIGEIQRHEGRALLVLLAIGLVYWGIRQFLRVRRRINGKSAESRRP